MPSYSADQSPLFAGRSLQIEAQRIAPDGCWTWFTDPRAVYYNGSTYIGWVDSVGTVGITKYRHFNGAVEEFNLSSVGFNQNDHANAAVHILPNGKIMAIYGEHNDASGMRYRISTNPEDISAWSSEVILAVSTPYTYSNPHYLSQTGKTYCHYRSGQGGAGTNPMNVRAFDGAAWDTERTWLAQTDERPYVKSVNNGVDRIDFLITDKHPDRGSTSVYHFYMQLDGSGTEKFYTSNGTEIAGTPTPADATLIYDGTTVSGWVWDIAYGADGHPRVLFTRFPSITDHRYMYSRWNGSAWTAPVEIAPAGTYLYEVEAYYSGGLCFDSADADVVYLSSSSREIQEWSTADGGATWSKQRDVTLGSSDINCRPFSPKNHRGMAVCWWRGAYNTFTDYDTEIWGVGR